MIPAPKSHALTWLEDEVFQVGTGGVLCFLPLVRHLGLDRLIEQSLYPQTKTLSRVASILSFLALKWTNIRRYRADDLWCMDRGLGLFAGLNILPKATWFSSYSSRVTSAMNTDFLKRMHALWAKASLYSDTAHLDVTTIPYWGDDTHLEHHWSGKRNKALASMQALLAQDAETGIISYGRVGGHTSATKPRDITVFRFLSIGKEPFQTTALCGV